MEGAETSESSLLSLLNSDTAAIRTTRIPMARLEQALELRQLAQRLAISSHEASLRPEVIFSCLARLQKARPYLVASLRSTSLGQRRTKKIQHPKLKLWQSIATPDQVSTKDLNELLAAISQTEAWHEACRTDAQRQAALSLKPWNHKTRLKNAPELLRNLKAAFHKHQAVKLIFWHHYDSKGFVPHSWHKVLAELIQKGWVVVVSTSGLAANTAESLQQCGCLISHRQNLGLCLGAYRDFCCLLDSHHLLRDRIQTLVLCNDSTLPLGGAEPLCIQAETIHRQLKESEATLIGLTDSVETRAYHVQSYFLALNSSLLSDSRWNTFWHCLDPRGEKRDLILRGEVGLSQYLLRHNIKIEAVYSLTSILLKSSTIGQTLEQLDLRQPEQINTTLMCWSALLEAGCPVIKKQLLLEPPNFIPQTVPMARLNIHLTAADKELIEDLGHLLQSRFLRP